MMAVVVLDVEVQDVTKLPPPGDQEVVQALPAYGANPALGDGIGVRRLNRCADDLGADRAPDVVEGSGELAVSVVDQEPDGRGIVFEGGEEVTGLLGDPGTQGSVKVPECLGHGLVMPSRGRTRVASRALRRRAAARLR